eukprot:812813-Pelagomonas_calceolata.AAC.1
MLISSTVTEKGKKRCIKQDRHQAWHLGQKLSDARAWVHASMAQSLSSAFGLKGHKRAQSRDSHCIQPSLHKDGQPQLDPQGQGEHPHNGRNPQPVWQNQSCLMHVPYTSQDTQSSLLPSLPTNPATPPPPPPTHTYQRRGWRPGGSGPTEQPRRCIACAAHGGLHRGVQRSMRRAAAAADALCHSISRGCRSPLEYTGAQHKGLALRVTGLGMVDAPAAHTAIIFVRCRGRGEL